MKGLEYSHGDVIKDKYHIKELIGSGTFSQVYKVWDVEAKEDRALHVFMQIEGGFSKSAPVVFELLKEMKHNSIPKQFEWFQEENFYITVEEYIIGTNLSTITKNKFSKGEQFTFEETLPIMEGIVEVLTYAHKYMPHCYLRPQHIFVSPQGRIVVADFGIPYIYNVESFSSQLIAKGDPYYYLPPEFISTKGLVSRSADVYSIGILLYELLTGRLPKKEKAPPSSFNSSVDEDIDRFILKCIEDEPSRRFADIIEFKKEYFYLLDVEYEKDEKYESPFILFDLIASHKEEGEKGLEERETFIEELFEEKPQEKVSRPQVGEVKEGEISLEAKPVKRLRWMMPAGILLFVIVVLATGAFILTHKKKFSKPSIEVVIKESGTEEGRRIEEKKEIIKKRGPKPIQVRKSEEKIEGEKKVSVKPSVKEKKPFQKRKLPEKRVFSGKKGKIPFPKKELQPVKRKKRCPDDMVYIPAGSFIMGSAPDDPMRNIGEVEAKKVYVRGFCIDRYEFPNRKGVKPMINVTYMEAEEECRKRGKRLCTEEEWERACKGPSNLKYPYGNSWNPSVCVTETGGGVDRSLQPAGSMARCRSGYGIYDMSGNVKEWVSTLFMKGLPDKVIKGGSFARPDYAVRCATRDALPPGTRDPEVGFRCCKEIEK